MFVKASLSDSILRRYIPSTPSRGRFINAASPLPAQDSDTALNTSAAIEEAEAEGADSYKRLLINTALRKELKKYIRLGLTCAIPDCQDVFPISAVPEEWRDVHVREHPLHSDETQKYQLGPGLDTGHAPAGVRGSWWSWCWELVR